MTEFHRTLPIPLTRGSDKSQLSTIHFQEPDIPKYISRLSLKQTLSWVGGPHSTMEKVLALYPVAPGSNPGIPKSFLQDKLS